MAENRNAGEARPEMSPYEVKALAEIQQWYVRRAKRRKELVPKRAREAIRTAGHKAADVWEKTPRNEALGDAVIKALEGLRSLTLDPAMRSVRTDLVVRSYAKRHPDIDQLDHIRALDLRECDQTLPNLRFLYASTAGAEGAAASLAITGVEVSTTVSGGATAPVVIGAVTADAAAVLALAGRVVAHTGAYYGYDTREPGEEMFALSVLSLSSAATGAEKAAALASISRLCQQMMRRATWRQLNEHLLVQIINQIYTRLGLRLTKAGLSKAVPVAGAVLGAGFNAHMLDKTARDARMVYRMRFLVDKYGLDPSTWTVEVADPETDPGDPITIDDFPWHDQAEGRQDAA